MALTMKEKKAVTREFREDYRKTGKKGKGLIIDQVIRLTGYSRVHAARLLRAPSPTGSRPKKTRLKRNRPCIYGEDVLGPLKTIWAICGYVCGKRLAPFLPEMVAKLEKEGELSLTPEQRLKLSSVSAPTIDRMLGPVRKALDIKSKSRTKPGSLLKHQIPIRTFADWDNTCPGFIEIDLVGHDGGDASGDYAQTLDATDISTCWTESIAVKNKAQRWVFEALQQLRCRFPFPILGIDSDNGTEFINNIMLRYCQENTITFTRGREYRKNDNCYVEQKNYTTVRQNVGYGRFDTPEELETLNTLYMKTRLMTNLFQPVRKLLSKERLGSKTKKRYDGASTPLQRVLASSHVSDEIKQELKDLYEDTNPAQLRRDILELQSLLLHLQVTKTSQRG